MAVTAGSSASVPMGSLRRPRQAPPSAYGPDRPSLHRCERNSPVKNRKRETRASGSVRGEDGNVLTYSAHVHKESARNTGSPSAWSGMTNWKPARDRPGAWGGGEVRCTGEAG